MNSDMNRMTKKTFCTIASIVCTIIVKSITETFGNAFTVARCNWAIARCCPRGYQNVR